MVRSYVLYGRIYKVMENKQPMTMLHDDIKLLHHRYWDGNGDLLSEALSTDYGHSYVHLSYTCKKGTMRIRQDLLLDTS